MNFYSNKPEEPRKDSLQNNPLPTEEQNGEPLDQQRSADLENELKKVINLKQKVEEENKEIRVQLLEMEEKFMESKKEREKIANECAFYREESEKIKAKNGVIENYASDLQRKVDMLALDVKEKSEELEKLKNTDWTKRLMECNSQIENLREQLLGQEQKYTDLKSQLNAAAQLSGGNKKHFETFVEEQSKELLKARKIVFFLLFKSLLDC